MKRILIICTVATLWLCSCGNSGEEVSTYTYEDLSSEQQTIVNNIYTNYSVWDAVYDSGRDIMVSKINFLYEEDTLLFVTYYDEGNDGVGVFCRIMEVGENGVLTEHVYENTLFNEEEKTNERAATMAAITGFEYPLIEEECKNVLANAFYKAQIENENE